MKLSYFLRRTYLACAAAVAAAALSANGFAAPIISFSPVTQTVNVGDTAVVALQISGLTSNTAPALGSWAVDLSYDPAVVSIDFLTNVAFGLSLNPIGEPLSDQGGDSAVAGLLNLFEISMADPLVLAGAQGDTFTLATLSFTALANGVSPLTAAILELGDENGIAITGGQANRGEIRVGGGVIPEPGTGLFAVAMVLTALTERRKKSRASSRLDARGA